MHFLSSLLAPQGKKFIVHGGFLFGDGNWCFFHGPLYNWSILKFAPNSGYIDVKDLQTLSMLKQLAKPFNLD